MPALVTVECVEVGFVECTSRDHDERKGDDEWWSAQLPGGVQKLDGVVVLELRHCRRCMSTLARAVVPIDVDGNFVTPARVSA